MEAVWDYQGVDARLLCGWRAANGQQETSGDSNPLLEILVDLFDLRLPFQISFTTSSPFHLSFVSFLPIFVFHHFDLCVLRPSDLCFAPVSSLFYHAILVCSSFVSLEHRLSFNTDSMLSTSMLSTVLSTVVS